MKMLYLQFSNLTWTLVTLTLSRKVCGFQLAQKELFMHLKVQRKLLFLWLESRAESSQNSLKAEISKYLDGFQSPILNLWCLCWHITILLGLTSSGEYLCSWRWLMSWVHSLNSSLKAVILSSCRLKANVEGLNLQLLHAVLGRPNFFWKLAPFDDGCRRAINYSSYFPCSSCATPAKRELGH